MTKLIAEIGINYNGSYKITHKICDFLCKIYFNQLVNRCERQLRLLTKNLKDEINFI